MKKSHTYGSGLAPNKDGIYYKYTTHEVALAKAKGFRNTVLKANEIAASDLLNDVVFGAFDDETDGQFDEAVEDRADDCAEVAEMAVDDGAPTTSPLEL